MKTISFIKILKYDLKIRGEDCDFEWLRRVTLQEEDPKSSYPNALETVEDAEIIYYSPLRRAVECLPLEQTSRRQERKALSYLKEIKFDLGNFFTKEEFLKNRSFLLRSRFKEYFIKDKLAISRDEIFKEVREVLILLYKCQLSRISVVSHSFRLSIIESFIKTEGMIVTNPDLIHHFILDDYKRFNFGEGFIITHPSIFNVIGEML